MIKKTSMKALSVALTCALTITVMPGNLASAKAKKVTMNKTKVTLTVGKSTTLKLKNNKKKIKWSTSNKKVATVSVKGKVVAKKKGTAKITAKVGKKKYTCKVTVKAKKSNTNTSTASKATTAPVATATVMPNVPAITNAPVITNTPSATNAPDVTNTPVTTDTPNKTDAPSATNTPAATDAPAPTDAPTVTNPPATTDAPVSGPEITLGTKKTINLSATASTVLEFTPTVSGFFSLDSDQAIPDQSTDDENQSEQYAIDLSIDKNYLGEDSQVVTFEGTQKVNASFEAVAGKTYKITFAANYTGTMNVTISSILSVDNLTSDAITCTIPAHQAVLYMPVMSKEGIYRVTGNVKGDVAASAYMTYDNVLSLDTLRNITLSDDNSLLRYCIMVS